MNEIMQRMEIQPMKFENSIGSKIVVYISPFSPSLRLSLLCLSAKYHTNISFFAGQMILSISLQLFTEI